MLYLDKYTYISSYSDESRYSYMKITSILENTKQDNNSGENSSNSSSEKGYSDTLNLVLSVVSFVTVILLMVFYFIVS